MKKLDIILIIVCLSFFAYFMYNKYKVNQNLKNTIGNINKSNLKFAPDSVMLLGDIKNDSIYYFKFSIINNGPKKLYIRDFTSSCGCTKIENQKNDIEINDSSIVRGSIDTKGKIGKSLSMIKFKANTEKNFHRFVIKYNVIPKS